MADIYDKVQQIRQAVYGKDVRETIAQGIEAINGEVENVHFLFERHMIAHSKQAPQPLTGFVKRIETYDDIVSIPNNANGQISVTLKGNTYTNLLGEYGNCESLTGWTSATFELTNDCVIGSKAIKATRKAGETHLQARLTGFPITLRTGKSYLISGYLKNIDIDSTVELQLRYKDNLGTVVASKSFPSTKNIWMRTGFVFSPASDVDVVVQMSALYATGTTFIFDGIMITEIPDSEKNLDIVLLLQKYPYIDGTKSTISAGRIKVVGKNLLKDGEFYDSRYAWEQGFLDQSKSRIVENTTKILRINQLDSYSGAGQVVRVKKGENITLSAIKRSNNTVILRITEVGTIQEAFAAPTSREQRRRVSRLLSSVGVRQSVTLTSVTTDYVVVTVDGGSISSPVTLEVEDLMLEYGTTATDYKPYKESNAYVIAKDEEGNILELRSLPNGVKDEIRVSEGKLIKRVSDEVVIDGSLNWGSFLVIGENQDSYRMSLLSNSAKAIFPNAYLGTIAEGYIVGRNDVHSFISGNFASATGKPYKMGFNETGDFFITIDKAYLDTNYGGTLTGFKNYLNAHPITLIYQLASPVISKVDVFGDLKAFPGGTIYFEPTLWGFINFDYGQNSKVITTPDVPIGSIRKVVRYDITDDGRLVATDVTADCTHNGTTLTIANAEPKKTYFYDCEIAPGYYTSAEKIIDVGTHEGVVEHDYGAAAADWVLSTNEALATMLVCKNAGGAAKIIAPAAEGKMYIIRNVSGQTITIKTASSTGVTVANGKTAAVIYYGDFIKISEI